MILLGLGLVEDDRVSEREWVYPARGGYMRSICRSCLLFGSGIVQGVDMTSAGWFVECRVRTTPLRIDAGDFMHNQ